MRLQYILYRSIIGAWKQYSRAVAYNGTTKKNEINKKEHGFPLSDARFVFADPCHVRRAPQ